MADEGASSTVVAVWVRRYIVVVCVALHTQTWPMKERWRMATRARALLALLRVTQRTTETAEARPQKLAREREC